MNQKFNRTCELWIQVMSGEMVKIPPEISVEFTIRRDLQNSSQQATFKVFNLGEKTRDQFFKDLHTEDVGPDGKVVQRKVEFYAGYGNFRPLLFRGYLRMGQSYRERVDFITELECYDGGVGMAYGFTSLTLAGTKTRKDILRILNAKIPGIVGKPYIGEFPSETTTEKGVVLVGNTWELVQRYSDNKAIIDNSRLLVLGDDEAIEGEIAVISPESGLIGTPRRGANRIEVPMVFEPRFVLGQAISLQSVTWAAVNRQYRVAGFLHQGVISPAVAGTCNTTVLLYGPAQFRIVAEDNAAKAS